MWTCGGGGQEVGVGGEVGVQDLVLRALETCQTHHQFIASQAEHLERLRSQCATSAQLTQQEIRTLEASPGALRSCPCPSLFSSPPRTRIYFVSSLPVSLLPYTFIMSCQFFSPCYLCLKFFTPFLLLLISSTVCTFYYSYCCLA